MRNSDRNRAIQDASRARSDVSGKHGKPWTSAEVDVLHRHYSDWSTEALSISLGRSFHSVRGQLMKQGLMGSKQPRRN